MAFLRYANAVVLQPQISSKGWSKVRKAAVSPTRNLVEQATEILGGSFDPSKHLLTHCTIVCSVDVESVPGIKLGKIKVGRKEINRKWAEYAITPETDQFINHNFDAWSRPVLLASYKTFVGAHNFQEHVQIEEQSKGRVIDAVARDIGESVYIDILVATDRKHEALVKDIESGRMGTLSMGCSVEFTQCTKCGNVAADETDLCDCVRYAKGNRFQDDRGITRRVAELCGHPSLGPTAGVTFIDASWVATPAFTGAVLRNIIEPGKLPEAMAQKAANILSSPPPEWDTGVQQKAASQVQAEDEMWGDEGVGAEEPAAETPATPEKGSFDSMVDDVYTMVRERVKNQIQKDLEDKKSLPPEASTMAPNETLRKEGLRQMRLATATAYRGAVVALLRTASSDIAFLEGLAVLNASFGIHVDRSLYRAALLAGSKHESMDRYLTAASRVLNRSFSPTEKRVMVRLGSLLNRLGSPSNSEGE